MKFILCVLCIILTNSLCKYNIYILYNINLMSLTKFNVDDFITLFETNFLIVSVNIDKQQYELNPYSGASILVFI